MYLYFSQFSFLPWQVHYDIDTSRTMCCPNLYYVIAIHFLIWRSLITMLIRCTYYACVIYMSTCIYKYYLMLNIPIYALKYIIINKYILLLCYSNRATALCHLFCVTLRINLNVTNILYTFLFSFLFY